MAAATDFRSPEVRFKRFLYTSTEIPKYITGDPELHEGYEIEKIKSVADLLQSRTPEVILNILEIVNSENLIPRRQTLFFAFAVSATLTTDDVFKHKLYTTLLNIIKNSEDLCTFLKFYTKQKKNFSSAINKVIGAYYFKKEPHDLIEEVTTSKGYHSWTHKDLIKLSHCKSESILTSIVVTYILFGLERAKKAAEENAEAVPIIERLIKIHELKRSENEDRIIELVKELRCSLNRVPSFFHHSLPVWDAVLPEVSVQELITYLPKLYKLGFLKANTPFLNKVIAALTNAEKIKASKIHPVEVVIGLRNFEKGGKPIDPKFQHYLETTATAKQKEDPNVKKPESTREAAKCPQIVGALHKAMQISFENTSSTGRKFLIVIDMNDKMGESCLTCKNVVCWDAATILALCLLRVEKNVTVAVFNGNRIAIVPLEKNITFNQALAKLQQAKRGFVYLTSAIEWAIFKKKPIDVFINIMHSHHWFFLLPKELRDKEKPLESLKKYRKKMSLPQAKLITVSLASPQTKLADGTPNVLDICGFSKEIPIVIEAFSKGLF